MFDCIISSPSYSELIQDNLWRIELWHGGNIQDNGLVWHLWFDPTLSVQELTQYHGRSDNTIDLSTHE